MKAPERHTAPLRLDLVGVTRILAAISVVVMMLGIGRELFVARFGEHTLLQDLRHFDLDAELSLPAWYSSLLMVAIAALLYAISRLTKRDGDGDPLRWTLLAVVFAAMAIDESVSFHEVLIEPLRGALDTGGIFHFAWVLPGALGVALLGAYYVPFLLRLPIRSAVTFAACGAVYVGGALGMELVGGAMADRYGMLSAPYLAAAVVEESLEIVGLTAFIAALVGHLARHWPRWEAIVAAAPTERPIAELPEAELALAE